MLLPVATCCADCASMRVAGAGKRLVSGRLTATESRGATAGVRTDVTDVDSDVVVEPERAEGAAAGGCSGLASVLAIDAAAATRGWLFTALTGAA